MTQEEKTRINFFRRNLYKHGFQLVKGREPLGYMVLDARTGETVAGDEKGKPFSMNLEAVARFLEKTQTKKGTK